MGVLRGTKETLQSFAAVFSNPNLGRLQLAGVGSTLGTWAYGVGLAVYAYVPSVEPTPASCRRRSAGFEKTAPNDRSVCAAPPRIPTIPEDCSLCCELEDLLGRFQG